MKGRRDVTTCLTSILFFHRTQTFPLFSLPTFTFIFLFLALFLASIPIADDAIQRLGHPCVLLWSLFLVCSCLRDDSLEDNSFVSVGENGSVVRQLLYKEKKKERN